METLRTVGISVIGAVFATSILSMIIPAKSYEKVFGTVTGVYLVVSILSLLSGLSIDESVIESKVEDLSAYEEYGGELTKEYFIINLKEYISEKIGIEEDKINIELKVSDEKEITVERVTVETESTKGLEKLSEILECEIEVVN